MKHILLLASFLAMSLPSAAKPLKVFILAGQSNMVGSDSKVADINRFPPFAGLDKPQEKVRFSYNIGREEKLTSAGWVALQPVDGVVGPGVDEHGSGGAGLEQHVGEARHRDRGGDRVLALRQRRPGPGGDEAQRLRDDAAPPPSR